MEQAVKLTPAQREKARRQLTSPRYRRAQSERMRQLWADREWRQRTLEQRRKAMERKAGQ
jgi:hypothetical protein